MTKSASKSIKKLIRAVGVMRSSIDENIPLTVVHTFLTVIENPGEGVMDLAARVGVNKSTMSRHLLDLSVSLRSGAPGYNVLNRIHDSVDLRAVRYTLTPKGELIVNQLLDIMED